MLSGKRTFVATAGLFGQAQFNCKYLLISNVISPALAEGRIEGAAAQGPVPPTELILIKGLGTLEHI